jgi:hypothetical protein
MSAAEIIGTTKIKKIFILTIVQIVRSPTSCQDTFKFLRAALEAGSNTDRSIFHVVAFTTFTSLFSA